MLLARKGHRVLVLEKASFPSDTMSTLYLQPPALDRLKSWGLLDRVRASGCPSIKQWRVGFGDVVLTGFPWSPAGWTEGFAPRRTVLDPILADAAVEAGAELRTEAVFEDVLRDGDAIVGVRGRTKSGAPFEERAKIVVGADGMRSPVAAAVGAEKVVDKPSLTCGYYAFYSAVAEDLMGVYAAHKRWIACLPTNHGHSMVYVGWPHAEFHAFRADLEGNFLKSIDEVAPELGARVRAAKREERFVGTQDVPNFFRRSHGPGWVLAGDAAYHKDPCTAQGISDAFRSAESVAEAVHEGLSGARPMANALADAEKRRTEAAMPVFEWTMRNAEMRPVSQRTLMLLTALKASQEDTNRFMGLNAGTVLPTDFFQPDNLARIVSNAMA
jgi:2-polyprenyl-6-methoxyphenol hydroxylase-like FAD-dependent oxidoreductase